MKTTLFRLSLFVLAAAAAAGAVSRGNSTTARSTSPGESRISAAVVGSEADRKQHMRAVLRDSLAGTGLLLNEEFGANETAAGSAVLHVRLDAPEGDTLERSSGTAVRLISSKKRPNAQIRLQRSFELASSQLVFFTADRSGNVVWWEIRPDPRKLRAEIADAEGRLTDRSAYRESADVLVSVPAGMDAAAVHIFSPVWDGNTFSLEPIGRIDLDLQGN